MQSHSNIAHPVEIPTESDVPLHTDAPLHNRPGTTWFTSQGTQDPSKMQLYCKIKLGWHNKKTSIATMEGNNPSWAGEAISLKVIDQEQAKLKIKDKAGHLHDKTLGHAHSFEGYYFGEENYQMGSYYEEGSVGW